MKGGKVFHERLSASGPGRIALEDCGEGCDGWYYGRADLGLSATKCGDTLGVCFKNTLYCNTRDIPEFESAERRPKSERRGELDMMVERDTLIFHVPMGAFKRPVTRNIITV